MPVDTWACPPPVVPPVVQPEMPILLPNTGTGGVGDFLDTFGWRVTLAGLVALSGFSLLSGARLLRNRC